MFLATASTRRPVAMASLLIALVCLGANSYRKLSLENLPSADIPYVTITATWPGATSEDMEKDVAKRIEDAVSGVEGLKHVYSTCIENAANVLIEFNMGTDVDIAAQDVREKLDPILSELPEDCDDPIIQKLDLNATAICNIFLSGDMPLDDLYWYADNQISDRFASVDGVAEVDVIGGNEREIWVELDRDRLAAAGLSAADVAAALQRGILSVPSGRIRQHGSEYSVKFDAEYKTIRDIETLQVATGPNGERRYLSDLATVRQTTEEVRQRAFLDGKPGIAIQIIKKSDGNTVTTIQNIRERFDEIRNDLPPGVQLQWLQDDGEIVQVNVDNTLNDIVSSIGLCAVILFAFLINLRTTFIVAVTMPITVIISFFFMELAGQTLNVVSLLAIGLSAGILVSNSIVVLENIARRFNDTPDRWEAACKGTNEVAVAVLASAGTNVVVMLPIAMMSSIVGQYFRPFALTTLIVNIASIFISFTLTPILCALWMRNESERTGLLPRLGMRWEQMLTRWGTGYAAWLRKIGSRRILSGALVLLTALIFAGTMVFGLKGLGFTMIEDDDWGRISIRLEFPDYYDLDATVKEALAISERVRQYPDVESVLLTTGVADSISGQASEGVYLAQISMVFKAPSEREWNISTVLQQMRDDLARVPDVIASVNIPGAVGAASSTLSMVLSGPDLDELSDRAQRLQQHAFTLPGVAQLDTSARDDKPEIRVYPNRPVLADLGVSPSDVGTILRANVDGIEAADFKEDVKTIDVRVKLQEKPGYAQVAEFPLPAETGRPIPMEALTTQVFDGQKVMIYRYDKNRSISFTGNERKGFASGTVMNQIMGYAEASGLADHEYRLHTVGVAEMLDETVADFLEAIILAALLTYLTMAAILESFSRPLVVLLTFPMGLVGVIWALQLNRMNISIFVLLGIVMLIGVVVNAAVLIIDKMDQLQRAGQRLHEAMYNAVADTFRAVLMVVVASGLGMIPIALSTGIGAVNRVGIGAASVGGILVAGIFTLTTMPLCYTFFTRNRLRK